MHGVLGVKWSGQSFQPVAWFSVSVIMDSYRYVLPMRGGRQMMQLTNHTSTIMQYTLPTVR